MQIVSGHRSILSHGVVSIMANPTWHNGQPRKAETLLRIAGCRSEDFQPGDFTEIGVSQSEIAALSVISRNMLGA